MAPEHKPGAVGDLDQCVIEELLDLVRKLDVDDRAATSADQVMVVMTRQFLGQLESRVVDVVNDAPNNARFSEEGKVPVGGTLCEVVTMAEEFRKGERTADGERLNDGAPIRGVRLPEQR